MNTQATKTPLNNPLTHRLADYREKTAKSKTRFPESRETWRNNRYPRPPILCRSSLTRAKDGRCFYLNSLDDFPGHIVGDANEIDKYQDHRGWYTDNFQYDTLIGAIVSFRNPHKRNADNGHQFYMPATHHSDWDGVTIYNEIYDDVLDAARTADHKAEREAEQCRDDHAKDQAEQQIQDLKDELHTLNKDVLPLLRELREHPEGYAAPICGAIKDKIAAVSHKRGKIFKRLQVLNDNYLAVVE